MDPLANPSARFCRQCGYDLRSQHGSFRCPECGREFNPSKPRTFLRRPPRALHFWLKRLSFVLLTVLLLLALTWGWLYRSWRSEQAAIRRLQPIVFKVEPLGGESLQRLLGSAGWLLERVVYVRCAASTTDASLAELTELSRLERLDLSDTQITDPGLLHLRNLSQLRSLNLCRTAVTDAGVKTIKNIEWLDLADILKQRLD